MKYIEQYFTELWILVLEMSPWLLLGLIFAGILKVYFPQKHIDRYLGKSDFKSSLNASLLGIPMPLCSCGVIPTGISFFKNGASKGATNSFLISTPQTGVDSILATYSMLGWPFAVLRPIVAFFTGVIGGVLTNLFLKEKPTPTSPFASFSLDVQSVSGSKTCASDNCGCEAKAVDNRHSVVRAADYAFIELLQDIAKWLILGFLAAALISVLLPNDFFSRFQGLCLLEILIVLLASVPIYICATGSIPIAAVLLMKGVSPGAALVFLMAGPATNVATMTVLGKTMGRKSLLIYLSTIIVGAVVFGLLTNWFLPTDFILSKITIMAGHDHEMLPMWLQMSSAVLLIGFIAGGYLHQKWRSHKRKLLEGVVVKVDGMTCSHCEANLKRNLEQLPEIESAVPDRISKTVVLSGRKINMKAVNKVIVDLGFSVEE